MEGLFRKSFFLTAILLICAIPAIAADSYLLKFQKDAAQTQVINALSTSDVSVRDYFPEIDVYAVDIHNPGKVRSLESGIPSTIVYMEKDSIVRASELAVPSDPRFKEQNQMRRMDVENAWNYTTGSKSVVIAVSDTGFAFNHPDLRNQVWNNPAATPGSGRTDYHGWDYAQNDNDPTDENGHGTHVAGIIGAEANNGVGIAGVNWNVSIMPIRFLDKDGSGKTSDGIATILYAAKNGAKVVNCSWGGPDPSQALKEAIDYAFSQGTLVIAAAGNDSSNNDKYPTYPASHKSAGLLAIASSVSNGTLSDFSNFAKFSVALAAPGSDVLSAFIGDKWEKHSGTSMATPMVSGVAGLILSVVNLSALDLRNALLNAIDQRDSYKDLLSTQGDMNARKAVQQLTAGFQVWPSQMTLRKGSQFQFTAYSAAGGVSWSVEPGNLASIDQNGVLTASNNGDVKVTATDANGATASTTWIKIDDTPGGGGGGGGCTQAQNAKDMTPTEVAGSAINYGLPILVTAFLTRRRRNKF